MLYNKGLILQENIQVVDVYFPNKEAQHAEAEAEGLNGEAGQHGLHCPLFPVITKPQVKMIEHIHNQST